MGRQVSGRASKPRVRPAPGSGLGLTLLARTLPQVLLSEDRRGQGKFCSEPDSYERLDRADRDGHVPGRQAMWWHKPVDDLA